MKCKVCWLFWYAFLGAMMMYCLRLAVAFRTNPQQFHCPCCGEVIAQAVISLVVTTLTFLSLYNEIIADKPREAWHAYIKAFSQAAVLELVIGVIQGH